MDKGNWWKNYLYKSQEELSKRLSLLKQKQWNANRYTGTATPGLDEEIQGIEQLLQTVEV